MVSIMFYNVTRNHMYTKTYNFTERGNPGSQAELQSHGPFMIG